MKAAGINNRPAEPHQPQVRFRACRRFMCVGSPENSQYDRSKGIKKRKKGPHLLRCWPILES